MHGSMHKEERKCAVVHPVSETVNVSGERAIKGRGDAAFNTPGIS